MARLEHPAAGVTEETPIINRQRLTGAWAELMQDIAPLGKISLLTRNDAASLAATGPYPELEFPLTRHWGSNPQNRLSLDFSRWHEVWALEETTRHGRRVGLEVINPAAACAHTLMLAPEGDLAAFEKLTAFYRTESAPSKDPGYPKQGAPWQARLVQRTDWLRSVIRGEFRTLSSEILKPIFLSVQERGIDMLAGVFSDAAIQRQTCTFKTVREAGGWLSAGGGGAGLGVAPGLIDEIWCVGGACACCGKDRWILEAYDHAHQLALTLQAADGHERQWREAFAQAVQQCSDVGEE